MKVVRTKDERGGKGGVNGGEKEEKEVKGDRERQRKGKLER